MKYIIFWFLLFLSSLSFANSLVGSNTSSTPLVAGGQYRGGWQTYSGESSVTFKLIVDTASRMEMQFSSDCGTISNRLVYQVDAGIAEVHKVSLTSRCFRIYILNTSVSDQTILDLQTYFTETDNLSYPVNLPLGHDSDSIATRPSNYFDEILIGRRADASAWAKFSHRDGLTAASGEQTVWDTTGNFVVMTTASTFTVTYNNSTDGAGTTGARSILVNYLDSSQALQVASHTLGSSGSDVTSFSGLGVNRVLVTSSGSAQINTGSIILSDTSGTFGSQGVVSAMAGVSQQAIFHVPAGYTGSIKNVWANALRLSNGAAPKIVFKAYIFSRETLTRHGLFKGSVDTSVENMIEYTEAVGFRLSGGDVIYFTADTDTNETNAALRFSLHLYRN
jgi:hypothetical protein